MYVIVPAIRLATARRADARRSCVWRSFDGEKATFALHKRTLANESGGVSSPWLRQRYCNGVHQHAGRQSSEQLRKRLSECVSRSHGGLTPAARDACAFVHRKSRNSVGGRTSREQERLA